MGLKGLDWIDVITGDDETWWRRWFIYGELHVFCDASEEAYATVIYLRVHYSDGCVLIRQVRAANKLAPKKTISILKLELNAALLGARLLRAVHSTLEQKIRRRKLWTDSSTVRNWIRASAAYYQIFVSNWIGENQTHHPTGRMALHPRKIKSSRFSYPLLSG